MAFWVTGRDAVSGEAGRMLSDAGTADEAIEQVKAQGLIPDAAEPAVAPADLAPRRPRWPLFPGGSR